MVLNSASKSLYKRHKEDSLSGRYVNSDSLNFWLEKISSRIPIEKLGLSVQSREIVSLTIGRGQTKILAWSQMHGNESTTTKAICDLINVLLNDYQFSKSILDRITLQVIPILNPDGAFAYTRVNANGVDLNRDAQSLSEPESQILRDVFDNFKPDYCFNLHGQRTIFGAGDTGYSATVSFLSPAEDLERKVTKTRLKAMQVIVRMNETLQKEIPDQIGIYDDAFNINCVGDTFQTLKVPTILFEAGHIESDYHREKTRYYIFQSLLSGIDFISELSKADQSIQKQNVEEAYFGIPLNKKNFYDIIIRNTSDGDYGIQFTEVLKQGQIEFVPRVKEKGDLKGYYGHREINAEENDVLNRDGERLIAGAENDFVIINNEKFALKLKNN